MAASDVSNDAAHDAPQRADLDKCVHCGLCLNACPTYRELHVEMDSPRGRIYQMVQVANGAPITDAYMQHIDLCLACRACETACPSGVKYGRLVEAARADIAQRGPQKSSFLRTLVFEYLLPSRTLLKLAGYGMYVTQLLRLDKLAALLPGKLREITPLAPRVELPFFYKHVGQVFQPEGPRKHRVAFLSGCIANLCFARLNEATVRVLQANGCEVAIPSGQTCCGALHVHAGLREEARKLARRNIDALVDGGFDAIITNAAGCGSTLKEYGELFDSDERAERFSHLVKDVTEFLGSIDLAPPVKSLPFAVTYQ